MRLGVCLVLAALILLSAGTVERLDYVFYDAILRLHERPANDELVIVAIDEKSLRLLGQWPWPRRLHARLLDKLTASGAGAVGFDILFSEKDNSDPEGDSILSDAIENNGNVVLVVGPESDDGPNLISEVLPLPDLAASAARLAHIDFEVDRDGVCRRVFLKAGLGDPRWPAMGLAMLEIAHPERQSTAESSAGRNYPVATGWIRERPMLISYAGPPGHIERFSYVDVLQGRVSPESLRDRIVMIGATAVGLGDTLSTPLSSAHTLMSGVEVNANVVATLLDGRHLEEASLVMRLLVALLLTLFLLLWLLLLPGRFALPGYILSIAVTLAISVCLIYLNQTWSAPTIPLLLQSVLYIAWSWLDLGQIRQLSQRLAHQMHMQARRDQVTGLSNRPQLEERLGQILTAGQESLKEFGLFILSMGRHRSVIDLAGIRGNDELHKQIALRLRKTLTDEKLLFRLDGAEFAILIDRASALPQLENIAARLVQSLLRPFQLGDDKFIINPSIGASRYPQDGKQAQELIDNAYTAMHRARRDRRRSFCFYSREIKADINKQSTIYQGLRNSAWTNELKCVYQPQISLDSGRIVGVETLVRWRHPKLGDVPPSEFIPVAEREGLIVTLGTWILHQACLQGQKWRTSMGANLRMAVNVSAVQLDTPGLLESVSRALDESGLPASNLELELTETALLSDHEAILGTLTSLKELGVELAIDDFGTGYSSLTYLKNFPIDRIKIDQSFITDVHESNESAEITRSIVAMTHGLDLRVIAEGVERPEHLEYLRELGCEEAQGYLIGKPMSPAELELYISSARLESN